MQTTTRQTKTAAAAKLNAIVVEKLDGVGYQARPNGEFRAPAVWTTDSIVSEMKLHIDKPEGWRLSYHSVMHIR